MKDIEFDPKDVTVAKGGTVTWTNNEAVAHDVTKEDGPGPDFASGNGGRSRGHLRADVPPPARSTTSARSTRT